jgi:protein-L-isoaspartate(D-aspartate) O-methyltransferase
MHAARGISAGGAGGLLLVGLFLAVAALGGRGPTSGMSELGKTKVAKDYAEERRRMVERQIAARGVRDPAVLEAMRSVPRHEFVPPSLRGSAHDDGPLPIGEGQTISQPYIVALMTEALQVGPADRVLELGTGSGYQAAVLAAIVDSVYTIEYLSGLARSAAERLARLGYGNVVVRAGDGWQGWPEHAPFDAAIITFAAPEVPPALVEQIVVGGRICIPLGDAHGVQELMVYTKDEKGRLSGRSLCAVRFVPVLGEGAGGPDR